MKGERMMENKGLEQKTINVELLDALIALYDECGARVDEAVRRRNLFNVETWREHRRFLRALADDLEVGALD